MELVNKFDNALAGVAGDSGTTGVVVNAGNRIETGKFWQMTSCDGHNHVQDRTQYTFPAIERDSLAGNILRVFGPTGRAPVYPPAPHCNVRGLSTLGAHLVKRMIAKEHDHRPRPPERAGAQAAARHRRGARSTRGSSPATPGARRTRSRASTSLGGFVTPYAGASKDFVDQWREQRLAARQALLPRRRLGRGHERLRRPGRPAQRAEPGHLSVQVFDGTVTVGQQRSGQRVYDIQGRRRPLRALSRLGRGRPPHRGPADRRRPRARGGGLPADVGARRRHHDRLPPGTRAGSRRAAGGRAARRLARVAAGARGPAEGPRRAALDLLRQGRPDGGGADAERARRARRLDGARPQGARGPAGGEDEEGAHGATAGAASSTSSGTGAFGRWRSRRRRVARP